MKPLIVFGIAKPNIYSFAKILGCLEKYPDIITNYEIVAIRESSYSLKFYKTLIEEYDLKSRPFIILTFSLFTAQFSDFQKMINTEVKKIKEINPNTQVIAGGWHATGDSKQVLNSGADFVFLGEAETILPQFLRTVYNEFNSKQHSRQLVPQIRNELKNKFLELQPNHLSFKSADGFYCKDIRGIHQVENKLIELDSCSPFSEKFRVFCPIEISRGCPFRCKFCQTGNYWNSMRHASVDTIVGWVKKAVEVTYDRVWFLSPNSFAYGSKNGTGTNPKAVISLLSQLKKIDKLQQIFFGTFPSEVRPEFVTQEMMDAVHPYINNKYFSVGAQSASDDLLKIINRGHNFQDVENAIDLITDYGYGVDLDFIFGLPGETNVHIQETLDFFKSVLKSRKKIRIHTHTFMPLPGTPFANEPIGTLNDDIKAIVGRLSASGKAHGQHQTQAKMKKKS